jgi:hypothetical protein
VIAISTRNVIITGMERQRIIRWLRIAVSAVWLTGLWVRSYWVQDEVWCRTSPPAGEFRRGTGGIRSSWGFLQIYPPSTPTIKAWYYVKVSTSKEPLNRRNWLYTSNSNSLTVHYWLPVFVTFTVAASLWIPWRKFRLPTRFSLRTLLIVTTLVAVVLGFVMWMVR